MNHALVARPEDDTQGTGRGDDPNADLYGTEDDKQNTYGLMIANPKHNENKSSM